ncbi:MAG: SDR family NAD(P)-dependent oxidoreductase [Gammaproteobacteria bacterium]
MREFRNRIGLVTGGASGIGRACALAFAREGMHVAVADLNEARARETATQVEALGVRALAIACDVSQARDVERARQAVLAAFGGLNLLMNNAGVLPVGSLEATPIEEWERVLRINLLSTVRCTQAFLPDLVAAGEAHIVNTASYAGLISYDPFSLAYSASKAAIVNFSEGIAVYLASRGIGVTCLCPGGVGTNIAEQIRLHGEMPATLGAFATRTAATRTAQEVGEMVLSAVRQQRFMVVTDDRILEEFRTRAADMDAYLGRIAREVAP